MTIWDDRILEIARNEDSVSPSKVAESEYVRVSRQHISTRMKKLAEHGLLQPLEHGVYIITERGERYLDGEISTYENEVDEVPGEGEDTDSGVPSPGSL